MSRLRLFMAALAVSSLLVVGSAAAFSDVPASHPYAAAIDELSGHGIISGYGDGRFGPEDPVRRAQFAKMIVGTFGLALPPERSYCPFADVDVDPADPYPSDFVTVAAGYEITVGLTPTTFGPYRDITRAQVITMVVRAFGTLRPDYLSRLAAYGFESTWGDFDDTHAGNAAFAEANGLLAGLPLASLDPWGKATRAEVAQILSNALDVLANPRGLIFDTMAMDEPTLVSAIEGAFSAQESRPGVYLPETLPEGYGVARPNFPFRWGEYDFFSGASNPDVRGASDYAVIYSDGHHKLALIVNFHGDWGDTPVVDTASEGRYGPLQLIFGDAGTVFVQVPQQAPGHEDIQVMAYREDMADAIALAESVRLVAPGVHVPEVAWE